MKSYHKKPVVIQAIQLKDSASQTQIIEWARENGTNIVSDTEIRNCSASQPDGFDYPYLRIPTKEGEMTASVHDFVIRGIKGEFYPCKPDIFEATYEAVE